MKDVVISGKRIRRELWVFAGCLVGAVGINLGAIVFYKTHGSELFTTGHITLAVALMIYILAALLRLIFAGAQRWFCRQTH